MGSQVTGKRRERVVLRNALRYLEYFLMRDDMGLGVFCLYIFERFNASLARKASGGLHLTRQHR